MFLHVDSDTAYLADSTAKSRVAGYFPLVHKHPSPINFVNGPILVECKTVKRVVASSSKIETAAAFHNSQIVLPTRYKLNSIDHPQNPTLVQLYNKTIENFIKNYMTQKRSKSWNMHYY